METLNQGDAARAPFRKPWPLSFAERLLMVISCLCVLGLGGLITTTIFTRMFFGWSIPDEIIFAQELMIGAVVLPLAYVAAERAHISVEVLTGALPLRAQYALNVLGSVVGFLATLPIAYAGWLDLNHVIGEGSYFFGDLYLPEWPGRLIFFIGYFVFVARLASLAIADAIAFFRNDGRQPPGEEHGFDSEAL